MRRGVKVSGGRCCRIRALFRTFALADAGVAFRMCTYYLYMMCMKPKISLVAAVADNYAIGRHNRLLWRLPADMKYFKQLTLGHVVVMGRRTFESLPGGPLPGRKNIVLRTVLSDGVTEGYTEATSLDDALELAGGEGEVFVIGGGAVYRECLDRADALYITWVHADFEADTFFPQIDFEKWEEVSRTDCQADERNPYDYSFAVYRRR